MIEVIYDNIETKFTVGEDYSEEIINSFTPGQKAIFTIWWLKAEVLNGGFNQYYFNPSGRYCTIAEESFKVIGATEYWALMKKSNEKKRQFRGISKGA